MRVRLEVLPVEKWERGLLVARGRYVSPVEKCISKAQNLVVTEILSLSFRHAIRVVRHYIRYQRSKITTKLASQGPDSRAKARCLGP